MNPDLFDEELEVPDSAAARRYESLLGLDHVKRALSRNAEVLLDPASLLGWSKSKHGAVLPVVEELAGRTPLFVFAGDVGTGKTTLAETFAHPIAVAHRLAVHVMRLSLRARGTGAVGEMTRLIGDAFDEVIGRGRKLEKRGALVLVIDEADAIAQSRELGQMHHEDRAGVNALIRGIDQVASERLRVVVVMCTNRLTALDPAVRRRAAAEFQFHRPTAAQRLQLFERAFDGAGFDTEILERFVQLTGDDDRGYGHTFSDLVNRVLPAAVLEAFPDETLGPTHVENAIIDHPPTPRFVSE